MFQLIKRNEYNDTAILKTADDVNELIKMAKCIFMINTILILNL